jgi:kynurenine formamidase
LIGPSDLEAACAKAGVKPAELAGMVLVLDTGMHKYYDDSKAYYHYACGTGVEAGKWFVKHKVKCVAMDGQALDHPLHTAMGNNGGTRMNLLGHSGQTVVEEYKQLFGEKAYAIFDKFEYIKQCGQAAYNKMYGELEAHSGWGTWEPCHKLMLGNGIVGVENLGGDLAKVSGKRFKFYCFPMRWYMGDGSIARCIAEIDESLLNKVPTREYLYSGTGYADEQHGGASGEEYIKRLFNRNGHSVHK